MNSRLFTSLRDRKFPGSPKGVLIFCSFPFVHACVFVCVLMRYRKARGPNKFPFLFCWLIIIIISIFSAIFKPFLSFYRSFSFFSSLMHPNGKKTTSANCKWYFDGDSSCSWIAVLLFGWDKAAASIFGSKTKSWCENGDRRAISWTGNRIFIFFIQIRMSETFPR